MEPRLVRDSGIGHGSLDRSGGYGFPAEPDVCDPIEEDIFRNYYTNLFIITLL